MGQGHPLVAAQEPLRNRRSISSPSSATSSRPTSRSTARSCSKEELRVLYQLEDPALAPAHLDAWLTWASRSRLEPFIKLARTIRRYRDAILNAIRLGLNNGRLQRPQQPHPPDQPPQLRLPLSRPPHRPRLPLLHRHHHQAPAMTLTIKRAKHQSSAVAPRGARPQSTPFPLAWGVAREGVCRDLRARDALTWAGPSRPPPRRGGPHISALGPASSSGSTYWAARRPEQRFEAAKSRQGPSRADDLRPPRATCRGRRGCGTEAPGASRRLVSRLG